MHRKVFEKYFQKVKLHLKPLSHIAIWGCDLLRCEKPEIACDFGENCNKLQGLRYNAQLISEEAAIS